MNNEPQRKWRELSPIEREQLQHQGIINGCGSKRIAWLLPSNMFRACCAQHDYNYYLGGTLMDKLKADWQFYRAMIQDVALLPWYKVVTHIVLATMYYAAVTLFGWWHFGWKN